MKYYLHVFLAIYKTCSNWLEIVYKRISKKSIKNIKLHDGTLIYIGGPFNSADLSMFTEIWYDKYYNPEGLEIKKDDIVFDIGANNGFFTFYAAQKAISGMIYTFEPVPHLVEKIKKTINLNNYRNIIIENLAVGDTGSECSFYISKEHNGCHSLYKRGSVNEKITVRVINLKEYCRDKKIEKINFLKLDCEGAEYDIINDKNIDFIKKTVDVISMEYHDNITSHTHKEIVKILSSADFKVKVSGGYIYAKNGNK